MAVPLPPAARRLARCPAGSVAVEFAFIAPILLLFITGLVGFGSAFATIHGVQQLASEAARASVAGLSDAERGQIARDFVARNVGAYALVEPARLNVTTRPSLPDPTTYEIVLTYDTRGTVMFDFLDRIGLNVAALERRALVKRGGY